VYERWTQKLAGWWDHPKIAGISEVDAKEKNTESLRAIWPVLCGETL
jgi:hypothetical protein